MLHATCFAWMAGEELAWLALADALEEAGWGGESAAIRQGSQGGVTYLRYDYKNGQGLDTNESLDMMLMGSPHRLSATGEDLIPVSTVYSTYMPYLDDFHAGDGITAAGLATLLLSAWCEQQRDLAAA